MHKSKVTVDTLMKRTVTIGLLGAILAVAVGFISTNAISATPFFMAASDLSSDESFNMIGHVEYTVLDSNGQIKQYVQGDNRIVDVGRNCSAKLIFNSTDDSGVCTPLNTGFNFIGIGNGTFANSDSAIQLDDDTGAAGCDGDSGTADVCEMDRVAGEVSIDTSNSGTTIVSVTTVTPFTFNHGGTIPINESGLFDDGAVGGGNMFSNRAVSGISVTSADTLAVTWTITLQ